MTKKQKRPDRTEMTNWLNDKGTGIYVTACVNKCGVNFVIDSGSTITVVSSRIFEKMSGRDKPTLKQVQDRFLLADGGTMNVLGRCIIDMFVWMFDYMFSPLVV